MAKAKLVMKYAQRKRRPPNLSLLSSAIKVDTVERHPANPVANASEAARPSSVDAWVLSTPAVEPIMQAKVLAIRVKSGNGAVSGLLKDSIQRNSAPKGAIAMHRRPLVLPV